MPILRIEHKIRDFDVWKEAFDRDPVGREQGGARRYRVLRPIDDPNYIMVDLEFDNSSEAEAFLAALRRDVWGSRRAAPALMGPPAGADRRGSGEQGVLTPTDSTVRLRAW